MSNFAEQLFYGFLIETVSLVVAYLTREKPMRAIAIFLVGTFGAGIVAFGPNRSNSIDTNEPAGLSESRTITYTVLGNQAWQNTGVNINSGDNLSIKYSSGLWDWTKEYLDFDAQGDPDPRNTCEYISTLVSPGAEQGNCPVPSAQAGSLVGKLTNGDLFLIGNSYNKTMPRNMESDQKLYLMINDVFSGLGDNDGMIKVVISVSRP